MRKPFIILVVGFSVLSYGCAPIGPTTRKPKPSRKTTVKHTTTTTKPITTTTLGEQVDVGSVTLQMIPKVDLAFPKPNLMRHQSAKREAKTIELARVEIQNDFKAVMDAVLHDLKLKAKTKLVETEFLPIDVSEKCAPGTNFTFSNGFIMCGEAFYVTEGEIVIKLDSPINKNIFEDAFDAVIEKRSRTLYIQISAGFSFVNSHDPTTSPSNTTTTHAGTTTAEIEETTTAETKKTTTAATKASTTGGTKKTTTTETKETTTGETGETTTGETGETTTEETKETTTTETKETTTGETGETTTGETKETTTAATEASTTAATEASTTAATDASTTNTGSG